MVALLNPVDRKKGDTKWGFVVHTSAMFSLATIFTGMTLNTQSVSYIDGRRFAGDASLPPGPLGYQGEIYSNAIGFVPCVAFLLNQWLSDGLLVGSTIISAVQVSNVGSSPSFIVATLFMP